MHSLTLVLLICFCSFLNWFYNYPSISFNLLNTFTEYMCHVSVRADGLAGVVISDHEYQYRVAHTMLNKVRGGNIPFQNISVPYGVP